jgi:hypothetical protein
MILAFTGTRKVMTARQKDSPLHVLSSCSRRSLITAIASDPMLKLIPLSGVKIGDVGNGGGC